MGRRLHGDDARHEERPSPIHCLVAHLVRPLGRLGAVRRLRHGDGELLSHRHHGLDAAGAEAGGAGRAGPRPRPRGGDRAHSSPGPCRGRAVLVHRPAAAGPADHRPVLADEAGHAPEHCPARRADGESRRPSGRPGAATSSTASISSCTCRRSGGAGSSASARW